MDTKLTEQLQTWLEMPADRRDLKTGATLVRRIVHNNILADNLLRMPQRFMPMVEYQLKKFLPLRLEEATHAVVEQMTLQVGRINSTLRLDEPLPGSRKAKPENRIAKTEPFVKGKRADHDTLPEEIQALYAENLHIMQQMRACHAQLLILSRDNQRTACPDGDRYPFVKEIIQLDKRYHRNWELYDNYGT